MQSELSSLEAQASLLAMQPNLSDASTQLWASIQGDRNSRMNRIGTKQLIDATWFSEAKAAKGKLEHFIQQTESQNPSGDNIEPLSYKLQARRRIHDSAYWKREDPQISQWATYPGMPVLLQRTQTVQDLLEEIQPRPPRLAKNSYTLPPP